MTAQIAAYGRLVADPQTKTTNKGTNMAMARMAVSLPCSAAQDGQATLWLGVLAFGKQADALAKHTKGDVVSIGGTMQVNQWTGRQHPKRVHSYSRQCGKCQNCETGRQTRTAGTGNAGAGTCETAGSSRNTAAI